MHIFDIYIYTLVNGPPYDLLSPACDFMVFFACEQIPGSERLLLHNTL